MADNRYKVVMPSTAFTASRTIIQIKTGAAAIEILECRLSQGSKTSTEFWNLQLSRWTAAATAGTVTSRTPAAIDAGYPAALAVGGASATGSNASVEPTGGAQTIIEDTWWNLLNGEWVWVPLPNGRIWIPQGGALFTLKNLSTPAASTNVSAIVTLVEYA